MLSQLKTHVTASDAAITDPISWRNKYVKPLAGNFQGAPLCPPDLKTEMLTAAGAEIPLKSIRTSAHKDQWQ